MPLQGRMGFVTMVTQGDALGWRVIAPLARNTVACSAAEIGQPEGLRLVSLGQRPRTTAKP